MVGAGTKRIAAGLGLLAILGVAASFAPGLAAAETAPPARLVVVDARIGDRPLSSGTRAHPIAIDPHVREQLRMTVRNDGPTTAVVRYLRLSGALLGVHFVHYEATINVAVVPGQTRTIIVPGDFFDVDGVARGFINASMQLVDQDRSTLATKHFVADVHGKLVSSVGFFFLEALAFALISFVDIIVGLYRRKLPRNRFVRALLFALAAASALVTIVIGAAMFRVALFATTTWLPVLLIASAIAFVLGYLSPGRVVRTSHEIAEDKVIDLLAAEAVARASGQFESRTTGEVVSHESGDHSEIAAAVAAEAVPSHHDSGEFTPPPHHDSGSHEPLA